MVAYSTHSQVANQPCININALLYPDTDELLINLSCVLRVLVLLTALLFFLKEQISVLHVYIYVYRFTLEVLDLLL